jgi:peptidyl-prolyl cis-trans isomerase A (cyclophilin A)
MRFLSYTRFALAACCAVALSLAGIAPAQAGEAAAPPSAVSAKLGEIAAAEFAYYAQHDTYAALDELLSAKMLAPRYSEQPQTDAIPFELAVSEDMGYFIAIARDAGGNSWSIDRTGVIKAAAAKDTARSLLDAVMADVKGTAPSAGPPSGGTTPSNHEGETDTMDNTTTAPVIVVFETTKGEMLLEVHPEWSPLGAAHFLELVEAGYYDGAPWFRVIDRFVAQCGIAADPKLNEEWSEKTIKDEPVVKGNQPGFIAFGKSSAPNSRSTHIFINLVDNSSRLDTYGFSAFARVAKGMDVAQKLFRCEFEDQFGLMQEGGLDKFKRQYPGADYITKAYVKEDEK